MIHLLTQDLTKSDDGVRMLAPRLELTSCTGRLKP